MSSGSLREVSRALGATLSAVSPRYPLPQDVQSTLQLYLDKHTANDEQESQRLQDELLILYRRHVVDDESKHAIFLGALRLLRPAIKGTERLQEWWNLLLRPTMESMGQQKGVVAETRGILLSLLVYDEDDDKNGEAARVSTLFAEKLLEIYLEKMKIPTVNGETLLGDDQGSRYVAEHLEVVLIAFGRKKPKALLSAIDNLIVNKDKRAQALSLLCTFVRHQPPHLYDVLQTNLIEDLLNCLMIDTSSTIITMALTSLVMFLPHIPNSLGPYLPRLFLVYSRLLCWERHNQPRSDDDASSEKAAAQASEGSPGPTLISPPPWDQLLPSQDDSGTPDPSHFFTFLYGLYPLNLMSYIRKPAKYLREAAYARWDNIDLDPSTVRQRTDQYRRLHLLHANFYSTTVEAELADNSRFLDSEPADVVAECMGHCVVVPESLPHPTNPHPALKLPAIPEFPLPTDMIPPQTPLSADTDGATLNGDFSPSSSRHTQSWRNTISTAMTSHPSDGGLDSYSVLRESVHFDRSHSPVDSAIHRSRPESPTSRMGDQGGDSPTLGPHLTTRTSDDKLKDMLQTQESLRNGIHRSLGTLANESAYSLNGGEKASPRLDAYIQSLSHNHVPHSPSLRPTTSDTESSVTYLQREILLLKNDLNFERYLKQQHLSHIGQLQRKYIREATAEAETQKLINSNRALKVKQEEARRALALLRKEAAASKQHAKTWEGTLNLKTKALREEQKQWKAEEEELRRQLRDARHECEKLRKLVVESEARELLSNQKVQAVQISLEQLEKERMEVNALQDRLQELERREEDYEYARQNEEITTRQIETLMMRLRTHENDRQKIRKGYESKISELESRLHAAESPMPTPTNAHFQEMLDSAMSSHRAKYSHIQRVYNRLLTRYAELEMRYMDLLAAHETRGSFEGSITRSTTNGNDDFDFFSIDESMDIHKRPSITSDPVSPHGGESYQGHSSGQSSLSFPSRPTRLESLQVQNPSQPQLNTYSQSADRTTPFDTSLYPFSRPNTSGSAPNTPGGEHPPKIRANSEVRVYGRGGVQNIGKKVKKEDKPKPEGSKKSLRPGAALKGIRGFV